MDPVYIYAVYGMVPVQWEFSTATAPWTNGVIKHMVGIFKKTIKDCDAEENVHSCRDGRHHHGNRFC